VATLDHEDAELEEELDPSRATILLVDDVPANLVALKAVLEPLGHRLVTARSGDEALRHLMNDQFALILMDVMMPEMDGYDTMREIRKMPEWKGLPILALTAKAMKLSLIHT